MLKSVLDDEKKCCACFSCMNICPKNSISMKKEKNGAIYPKIDSEKCIGCHLCRKVCPIENKAETEKLKKVYATYSKNEEIHEKSNSGGLSYIIASEIIKEDGIVYGAVMNAAKVQHERISDPKDLYKIQGSKYVHSHMNQCVTQISSDLKLGKKVVFFGTPCQVAAVKNYIKNRQNLLLVDILCHGVPTQDSLKSGIELETKEHIKSISFRDGKKYRFKLEDKNENSVIVPYRMSYWLNGFVEGYIFRENCYSCKYAEVDRCGDITLGDFWGLDKDIQGFKERDKGINLVMINTENGQNMWNTIKNELNYMERTIQEAIPHNHPLSYPSAYPNRYDKFINIYCNHGGKKALMFAYPKKTIFIAIRRGLRHFPVLYNAMKKIPKIGNKIAEYPTM